MQKWKLNMVGQGPAEFLPIDLDTSGFIDITRIGDSYRRYLDPATGTVHDGAAYHAEYLKELQ